MTQIKERRGERLLRKVYMYCTDAGRVPIKDFLGASGKKIQKKFEFMLNFIKNEKNVLCEPYVKHFSIEKYKLLYELRIRVSGTMVRIIFTYADENIILLHAFYKRDHRDTECALEQALKLLNTFDDKVLEPFEHLMEV